MAGALLISAGAEATVWQPPPDAGEQDPSGGPMAGPRRRPGDRPGVGDSQRRGEFRRRFGERRNQPGGEERMPPPEMVDWALEMMKTRLPVLHGRLSAMRQDNPQRFNRVFGKLMPFLKEYRMLLDRKPDLAETVLEEFKAEERLRELSRDFQAAKDDAGRQAAITQEIDQLVRRQFELRQKRFEARLEDFEERIKDQQLQLQNMKDQLQLMTNRKDEFVSRRISQVKSGRMAEGFPGMGPGIGGPRPGFDGRPPRPPPGGDEFGPPPNHPPPPHDDHDGPPPGPGDPPED
jgi:hypothetical protein